MAQRFRDQRNRQGHDRSDEPRPGWSRLRQERRQRVAEKTYEIHTGGEQQGSPETFLGTRGQRGGFLPARGGTLGIATEALPVTLIPPGTVRPDWIHRRRSGAGSAAGPHQTAPVTARQFRGRSDGASVDPTPVTRRPVGKNRTTIKRCHLGVPKAHPGSIQPDAGAFFTANRCLAMWNDYPCPRRVTVHDDEFIPVYRPVHDSPPADQGSAGPTHIVYPSVGVEIGQCLLGIIVEALLLTGSTLGRRDQVLAGSSAGVRRPSVVGWCGNENQNRRCVDPAAGQALVLPAAVTRQ